jgi:hypothetical protein
MSGSETIIERFQKLPRAVQWLVFAVVTVVLFRFWDAYLRDMADKWNMRADEIAREVAEVRRSSEMARQLNGREMSEVVRAIGPVASPKSDKDGGQMLQEAALSITREYSSVTEMSLDMRGDTNKINPKVTAAIAPGKRLARLGAELKFVASPEDTISIITDLEHHPDIESVTAIRLTRAGDRTLKVSLDLEAWVEES